MQYSVMIDNNSRFRLDTTTQNTCIYILIKYYNISKDLLDVYFLFSFCYSWILQLFHFLIQH